MICQQKQYLLFKTMMKTHQNYKKNFKFENYKLKNWKNLSFDFCPKNYADWPKSTTGGAQNIFWAKKSILKFFEFWTQKNSRIFSKFRSKFGISEHFFLTMLPNFATFFYGLTIANHLSPKWLL